MLIVHLIFLLLLLFSFVRSSVSHSSSSSSSSASSASSCRLQLEMTTALRQSNATRASDGGLSWTGPFPKPLADDGSGEIKDAMPSGVAPGNSFDANGSSVRLSPPSLRPSLSPSLISSINPPSRVVEGGRRALSGRRFMMDSTPTPLSPPFVSSPGLVSSNVNWAATGRYSFLRQEAREAVVTGENETPTRALGQSHCGKTVGPSLLRSRCSVRGFSFPISCRFYGTLGVSRGCYGRYMGGIRSSL